MSAPIQTAAPAKPPEIDQQQIYVLIWSKAVETQMHFNEMSVKSRQFGLAFVAAALGLGIALLSRGQEFALSVYFWGGFDIHAAVLLVFSGGLALVAVRVLDLNVYHKMLRGAVTFGEDFEENYMKKIFDLEKGMTQAISHYSRHQDATVISNGTKYTYSGSGEKSAYKKIRQFYNISIGAIFGAGVLLFLFTANFGRPSHQPAITNLKTTMSPASKSPVVAPRLFPPAKITPVLKIKDHKSNG